MSNTHGTALTSKKFSDYVRLVNIIIQQTISLQHLIHLGQTKLSVDGDYQ